MINVFYQLNDLIKEDSIFWVCAFLGSGLFLIQLILSFLGTESEDEIDQESKEFDFKWLSKQALTGFLMMFGWVGLTCRKEFDLSGFSSITISLLGGFLTLLLTGLIFKGAKKLRSTGTVFNIEETIGKKAMIYQQIPRNGTGKVLISFHQLTYEIDAISDESEDLPSFTSVQIIKKVDEKTVVVVPIK